MAIYTLSMRRHYGCGCCPTIYDICDAKTGKVVRSQLSHPSRDDCLAAVTSHRAARVHGEPTTPAKTTRPAGGAAAGRRGKRVNLHL